MFNRSYRKESIARLERVQREYTQKHRLMYEEANLIYEVRKELQSIIDDSLDYINSIKNKPMEIDTRVKNIKIEISRFSELEKIMYEKAKMIDIKSGGSAGAGLAAGAGVAAFGSKAAMGIAMTFGTASTGTAISTLSGAAATNADLAWLGGGALTAAGGGMAAGSALLALSGPVGWAIGGISLAGASLFSNSKNKKIIAETLEKTNILDVEIKNTDALRFEMDELYSSIKSSGDSIIRLTDICRKFGNNYIAMDKSQKYRLGTFVNNIYSSSELLNKGIGENKEDTA